MYSRAISRSPCSSNTKAGVPNSAATSASATPPTVRRPSTNSAVRGRISMARHDAAPWTGEKLEFLQANVSGLRDRPIDEQRADAQQRGDRLGTERVREPEDDQRRPHHEEPEQVDDGVDRLERRSHTFVRMRLLLRERDDLTHRLIIPAPPECSIGHVSTSPKVAQVLGRPNQSRLPW